jgi:hypothetical protein
VTTQYAVLQGSVLEVLRGFRDSCFDACMCDPPYGFLFMGKSWDYAVPSVETWAEVLRVLKPGAPLVAFGGSRTYHRLAVGIEDAGFELRDCLMWLYGKGFPKSQDVSKAIDKSAGATRVEYVDPRWVEKYPQGPKGNTGTTGAAFNGEGLGRRETAITKGDPVTAAAAAAWAGYGTALKPAHEPIVLARKPLDGTMVQNVERWGVGGLDIDGCRIEGTGNVKWSQPRAGIWRTDPEASPTLQGAVGRWPANLVLDEAAGALLDASVGDRPSRPSVTRNGGGGGMLPGAPLKGVPRPDSGYSDSGGPSRFFYCVKVSTKEREAGCEHLALRSSGEMTEREDDSAGLDSPHTGAGRTGGARNFHPTLKPISLTTWLGKLVKPPTTSGACLVPFSGAGSEMIGSALAGWPMVVGIEQDAEYIQIAQARLAHWLKEGST